MKALKIEPGKAPERIDIGNELEALQDAVGGYIQVLYPDQHRPVGLICNEEGKCMGLKPNRALYRGRTPVGRSDISRSCGREAMSRSAGRGCSVF